MSTLASKSRPKRFDEMVGQTSEVEVMKTILKKSWHPNAILIGGPFGTGKTTMARLIARALFCEQREDLEPCGECDSCKAMDRDNHPDWKEIDAASHGQVSDVRAMKDEVAFKGMGKLRIVCYDEAHVLTDQAQDAMLKMLEEGVDGVIFIFATTDVQEMSPTIRSRCVELTLKLLTVSQIKTRLEQVCKTEGYEYEPTALSVIGTYVRGHMRDALVLLEQLYRLSGKITEEGVRTYLRMDRSLEVYELLAEPYGVKALEKLEALLCSYSASELVELLAQVYLNVYKVRLGVSGFTQLDDAWLKKLGSSLPENVLEKAERVASINTDFTSITYAVSSIARAIFDGASAAEIKTPTAATPSMAMRKPTSGGN